MRSANHGDPYARTLAILQSYGILGTLPEAEFDIFPALCCATFDAPAALLQFFDGEQLWTKAEAGMPNIERSRSDDPMRETFDSATSLHVAGARGFFCGAPILSPDRVAIGAIGVFDARSREISGNRLQAIRTIATAVTHALQARRRLLAPPPAVPVKRSLYVVGQMAPSSSAEHTLEAVLTKIEAGRRLLRGDLSDILETDAFFRSMHQLLLDNDEPHVLVSFPVAETAAAELIVQARRARLLCHQDLVTFVADIGVVMLLRDMPVAVGYQAVKRFAHAQLNTNYRITEVHGPIDDVRAVVGDLARHVHPPR